MHRDNNKASPKPHIQLKQTLGSSQIQLTTSHHVIFTQFKLTQHRSTVQSISCFEVIEQVGARFLAGIAPPRRTLQSKDRSSQAPMFPCHGTSLESACPPVLESAVATLVVICGKCDTSSVASNRVHSSFACFRRSAARRSAVSDLTPPADSLLKHAQPSTGPTFPVAEARGPPLARRDPVRSQNPKLAHTREWWIVTAAHRASIPDGGWEGATTTTWLPRRSLQFWQLVVDSFSFLTSTSIRLPCLQFVILDL